MIVPAGGEWNEALTLWRTLESQFGHATSYSTFIFDTTWHVVYEYVERFQRCPSKETLIFLIERELNAK